MRIPLFALLLLSASCGDSGQTGTDTGIAPECVDLTGCGEANNFATVSFCEHCMARADGEVCEAGMCRVLGPTGTVKWNLSVPANLAGAKSFTLALVLPTKADGAQVTCASLKADANRKDNPTYNASNSTASPFPPGGAQSGVVYPAQTMGEAGSNRLLYIGLASDVQGKGQLLGHGCVDGIEIQSGQEVFVDPQFEAL